MALSQRIDGLHIFTFPPQLFCKMVGRPSQAIKTISCGQYFTKIFKHRDNCEIILWVPISSHRPQILLCRKKTLYKLIMKGEPNIFMFSDLPYYNRNSLQGK